MTVAAGLVVSILGVVGRSVRNLWVTAREPCSWALPTPLMLYRRLVTSAVAAVSYRCRVAVLSFRFPPQRPISAR